VTAPEGAYNVPIDHADMNDASGWGFDSAGINDNAQFTDQPTVDRHINP
jgi:hypothetical protein